MSIIIKSQLCLTGRVTVTGVQVLHPGLQRLRGISAGRQPDGSEPCREAAPPDQSLWISQVSPRVGAADL